MRERFPELVELRRRTVHFDADQIGHLHRRREHLAHVLEVREQRFRVDVAFTTKHFVAVDGELVEEIPSFIPRLGGEFRQYRG